MITYEQDPDVVRWGLQLFDGDPFSNFGYGGTVAQYESEYCHGQCFQLDNYATECCNVENDELIARALQENLSLTVAEESVSQNKEVENFQVSAYPHNWTDQSVDNYSLVQECGHEEEYDMGSSSLCSSPEEILYSGDYWSYSPEQADEYHLDGEVGKRLNQMVPVPHVPRINGEIPSLDEETLDHQRLLDRLQLYELVELKVQGDGNCQFRALSDQIYRTPEHHNFVRDQVVTQLKSCPEIYEGYVPMAYVDYLEKMSKSGEWGDHVTLQAAADSYGVKILVITSFKDTCYIEIVPSIERSKRVICLSFWAEVHYNSIYPEGDVPMFKSKRKKRWWILQNERRELLNDYE